MASNQTTTSITCTESAPGNAGKKTPAVNRVKRILLTFAACTLIAAALSKAASTTKKRRNSSITHLLQDCVVSLKSLIPTMNSVMSYLQEDEAAMTGEAASESRDGVDQSAKAPSKRARMNENIQGARCSPRISERDACLKHGNKEPAPKLVVPSSNPNLHTKPTSIGFPSPALGQISTGQYSVRTGDDVEVCVNGGSSPTHAIVTDPSGTGISGSSVTVVGTGEVIKLSSEHAVKILMDGTNYGSLKLQQYLDSLVNSVGGAAKVNTAVGDMVVLAGETDTDADHEMWLGIATSVVDSKVRYSMHVSLPAA